VEIAPPTKFCGECGRLISVSVKPSRGAASKHEVAGERRHLTILFCDIVGSTTMAARLDPEEWRATVEGYRDAADEAIIRFGGYIADYVGDGVVALFGYPEAHDNDAERAGRAGLAIIDTVAKLSEQPEQPRLSVRVGISSGKIVVGTGAGNQVDVFGDAANLAARVQAIADPGTVLISEATYRLVAGFFVTENRGARLLKGIERPVQLYRLIRPSDVQGRLEAVVAAGGLTPFVGRQEELGSLQRRWTQAKERSGQVVLLSGEPGIGKSRLVHELQDQIKAERVSSIEFRCSPYHQNSALYPIIDYLQRLLHFAREDQPLAKLSKLQHALLQYHFPQTDTLALLASLLSLPHPPGSYPITLSPQKQKQKTHEALVAWLIEVTEKNVVFCVWEDLQWADPSTLEVLTLFLHQLPTTRLLALLTFRSEFTPPWGSRPYISQITLTRLIRSQIEALINGVTDGKTLPIEVLQQIVAKTDGVPLFVEELTKMVMESGLLREEAGRYIPAFSGAPIGPLAIPSTIQDSLMARLDRLGSTKAIAQLGATIGREFTYELLYAVSPLDDDTLGRGLQHLVDTELIHQRGVPPHSTYFFRHALIQDTAYQSLLKRRRQELHFQIAEALVKRFGEMSEDHAEVLAHHYAAANQKRQALLYSQKAGVRALQRFANLEALAHAKQALSWLDSLDDARERATVELELNGIIMPALMASQPNGYASSALRIAAQRSLDLIESLGEDPHVFPTLWALTAYHHVRSNRSEARGLARRYLDLADRTNNVEQLTVALPVLAQCLVADGDFTGAVDQLERALKLYVDMQDRRQALLYGMDFFSYTYMTFSQVSWAMGYPDKALEQAQLSVSHARQLNHPNTLGLALLYLMMNYQQRHERDQVIEVGQDLDAVCERYGLPFNQSLGALIRNWARSDTETSYRILEANQLNGLLLGMTYYRSLLAESEATKGNYDQAISLINECIRGVDETGERYFLSPLQSLKGCFLLGQDSRAEDIAEECFKNALEVAEAQKAKMHALSAIKGLSKVWQRRNQAKRAREKLTNIYNEFTEGFSIPSLIDARNVIQQLTDI
jgi:TOMM system kinase/cyclase fusion protein